MIPLGDSPTRRSFPWVTIFIIGLNAVVFVFELALPSEQALNSFFYSWGTVPSEILTGRDIPPPPPLGIIWITLLTSMFVHGGFLHIASNMLYLWVFGDNVEDAFGHSAYLVFYLIAGVLAGLTHVFVNAGSDGAMVPSVGASGAIAGVLGAYLVMFPNAQVRTLLILGPFITWPRISAVFLIGFWFLMQLISGVASLGPQTHQTSGVAVWAHIGGFVVGVIAAFFLRPKSAARSFAA